LLSDLSARDAELAVRQLRCSNHDIAWVAALVDRWHREGAALAGVLRSPDGASDRDVRQLVAAVGRLRVSAFARLCAARWCALDPATVPSPARVRSLYRRLMRSAFRDALDIADLAIDGDDLRRAGVPPGRHMGELLAQLVHDVLDDPACNTREWLLARVAAIGAPGS
jgi:tRNA nucleotidyltransferase (CCA-adding enzyme)